MARSSERALCSEFCVLIGYPSGGKMEQYCPPGTAHFVPANKISPKFRRVHKSFLLLKLFSANTKRFFVISLSLRNQKTGKPKASRRMKTKKTKNVVVENKQVQKSFFSVLFIPDKKKLVWSRWLGIGLVLFLHFYGPRLNRHHKNTKRELGQYSAILTSPLVNKIHIYI